MDLLKRLSSNFYMLFGAFFLVWMVFIDSNDVISQYRTKSQLDRLEKELNFYQVKIAEVKSEREALLKDDGLLEKFARERYLMKKPKEDVYLIVEE